MRHRQFKVKGPGHRVKSQLEQGAVWWTPDNDQHWIIHFLVIYFQEFSYSCKKKNKVTNIHNGLQGRKKEPQTLPKCTWAPTSLDQVEVNLPADFTFLLPTSPSSCRPPPAAADLLLAPVTQFMMLPHSKFTHLIIHHAWVTPTAYCRPTSTSFMPLNAIPETLQLCNSHIWLNYPYLGRMCEVL